MTGRFARCVIVGAVVVAQSAFSSATQGPPPDTFELAPSLEGVPDVSDLRLAVQELLDAHLRCAFPVALASRIPHPPAPWSEISEAPQRHCLGALRVVAQRKESEVLVSMDLGAEPCRGRQASEVYVVFANYLEGRWMLSWPTPLGPPLHPISSASTITLAGGTAAEEPPPVERGVALYVADVNYFCAAATIRLVQPSPLT